jgi:hypothetical protein
VNKDSNLDFMDPDRREKLSDLYLSEPRALLGKEVKPLKNNRLDKFASNVEINFDLVGNAQLKAIEALEQGERDVGFWQLQNASDFIRNGHALANLERLRI